jgi:hypothetical protein
MYYAKISPNDSDSQRLFVRVTDLLAFDLDYRQFGVPIPERGLATSHHASTLVGDSPVVPRYFGMFANDMIYCLVFEDAGRSLTWEEMDDAEVQYVAHGPPLADLQG